MVPKWVQWPAMFLFAYGSLRFGIPPEALAAYRMSADPTWAHHIDFAKLIWPALVGAAISMMWTIYLVGSEQQRVKPSTEPKNPSVGDGKR